MPEHIPPKTLIFHLLNKRSLAHTTITALKATILGTGY